MSTCTTACTTASRALDEPLPGTASTVSTWLLLERPGPWGTEALTASHLDPAVGAALERRAAGTGVRVALIRRPGRPADRRPPARYRAFAAHTRPGSSWVRAGSLDHPARLLDLDLAALGAGDPAGLPHPEWAEHAAGPLALVCTNGRRDRCCAVLGRPLAAQLATLGAGDVWEVTHIGGHRFAPTLLVLPYGYVYGRATAQSAAAVLRAVGRGRMAVDGCRGRTAWQPPGQAAELAVRELTGEVLADAVTVRETRGAAPAWTVCVGHADGREWHVSVAEVAHGPALPASCGAAPTVQARMDVVGVRAVAHGGL